MRRTTIKKYTVNLEKVIEGDEDTSLYRVFTNLGKARIFAGEMLRAGNFKSLLNFKRIPLAI